MPRPRVQSTLARLAIPLICIPAVATAQPLTLRNSFDLPAATPSTPGVPSFPITGLSGITYATGTTYYACLDNSSHLIELGITLAPDGSILTASVIRGIILSEIHDFEGIAIASPTSVYLGEEDSPAVHEFDLATGARLSTLPTPAVFLQRRPNFGFESLTRRGHTIYTANEEALTPDGPLSTQAAGTVVRLQRYTSGLPDLQFAYRTEPLHGSPISGSRSGLSDLLTLPDGRLIALERSFAFNLAGLFRTRIFALDLAGATDTSALPSLAVASYTPIAKTLLLSADLTNLEGLCLGPRLDPPGSPGPYRYALLGIVDDGDPISTSRLYSFELANIPAPCYANCDESTAPPILNVSDFICFQSAFAAGSTDANCDGSTIPPTLNISDFICFSSAFAAGCP